MSFGDSEIKDTITNKLEPWLNKVVDYDDVEKAYRQRGKLQSKRIALLRDIESIEDEILSDEDNKPRANTTRIKKLQATKEHRDLLADIEMQIAENDSLCKWYEFCKAMFSAANFNMKIRMDI